MKIYLEITTWNGVGLGAQHWYGELKGDWVGNERKTVKLTRILTGTQAARANRYRSGDDWLRVRAGQESGGFDSVEEIEQLALKVWKEHFSEGTILIKGRSSVGDPQLVLAYPDHPEIIEPANKIFEQFESFEGYQHKRNWPKAEELNERWNSLLMQVV